MKQAQLASAFDGWVGFRRENVRRRAIMRSCAARLRNRVIAAALEAWTSAAAQRANKREAATTALRHWELLAAAAAFATWRDDTAEQLGTAAALSHHRLRILRVAFEGVRCEAALQCLRLIEEPALWISSLCQCCLSMRSCLSPADSDVMP